MVTPPDARFSGLAALDAKALRTPESPLKAQPREEPKAALRWLSAPRWTRRPEPR